MGSNLQEVDRHLRDARPILFRAVEASARAAESGEATQRDIEERWKELLRELVDEVERHSDRTGRRLNRWLRMLRFW